MHVKVNGSKCVLVEYAEDNHHVQSLTHREMYFNVIFVPGLLHTFYGMGLGPMELGKLAEFQLKLGKSIWSLCMKLPLLD